MTLANVGLDVEQTKHHLNSLAESMQSNGQPFKYQILCRVGYTGAEGLITGTIYLYLKNEKLCEGVRTHLPQIMKGLYYRNLLNTAYLSEIRVIPSKWSWDCWYIHGEMTDTC
jgi:hypothetical protein